jgi:hypothetical protein
VSQKDHVCGYKRTPTAALEREADIPPLDLYMETIALQKAESTADYSVYRNIRDHIWLQMSATTRGPARRNNAAPPVRPPTNLERARQVAEEQIREVQRDDAQQTGNQRGSARPNRRDRGRSRPRGFRQTEPDQAETRTERR